MRKAIAFRDCAKTFARWSILSIIWVLFLGQVASAAAFGSPLEGFVAVNGVRLQYLDWGGTGRTLILVHGAGDNPYQFADIAPALTDHFHVIAYARRGFGGSSGNGPYDLATLTEDLRDLMDALNINKADLVGVSAGGDEVTEMAAEHPERVDRIVYLDGAYDWSDPDFTAAFKAVPLLAIDVPKGATASLNAFRAYQHAMWFPKLDNMARAESWLRQKVVIQSDGSVRDRDPPERMRQHLAALSHNKRRNYAGVRSPSLAIYAETLYDLNIPDSTLRSAVLKWEQKYWTPFQTKSIDRARRELPNVVIDHVPGAHVSFVLMDKKLLVEKMERFLAKSAQTPNNISARAAESGAKP